MTGYSTPDGPAELHPTGCTCPACVDVEINAEDSASITGTTYHGVPLSNEREMQRAATLSEKMVKACQYGLTVEEVALMDAMCADQTPEHDDLLAGAWM